jgi:chromosome segregation ATPase
LNEQYIAGILVKLTAIFNKGNSMSEREQYIEKVKAQLDQWNAEIEKLQAKADEAEADAKIEYEKQINELRAQRDKGEAKVKELQEASNGAWADMKAGFDRAWDSVSNAFENAKSRFK